MNGFLRNPNWRSKVALFLSKNCVNLLCASFSNILSRLDSKAIGLKLEISCSDHLFLYRGMTFAVFSLVRNLPAVKERLNISEIMVEISLMQRCRILERF